MTLGKAGLQGTLLEEVTFDDSFSENTKHMYPLDISEICHITMLHSLAVKLMITNIYKPVFFLQNHAKLP